MAATRSRTFFARDRVVFTYEVGEQSQGLLTGYEHDGGFFVEHVVAFPGTQLSTLPRMLRAGIAEAWRRGYLYVALFIEHEHPLAEKLAALAEHFDFVRYAYHDGRAHYCRHRKSHEIPQETV